ncbi:MAG: hypothetical protein IJ209_09545 [Bacteroidaceae bacterium]|nr:hypothetical protein [Bacteroidaceae bacterium]
MASKNSDSLFVKCIDCTHASFMQWYDNPIIAQCKLHNDRQVACAKRICQSFAPATTRPNIEHFDSYGQ